MLLNIFGINWKVLHYKLFQIGGTNITPSVIITIALILLATFLLSTILRKAILRFFQRGDEKIDGNVLAINRLIHYALFILGIGIALQTTGFNLNALFAAGAVFAIGIGFAIQNIVQNFVSGVILLFERAIKPGDVLEVQDRVVQVFRMGIRTTIVRSRDGDHMIVPNSVLVQSTVKNYTLKESVYRIRAKVGVIYNSDLRLVADVLENVTRSIPWRLSNRDPIILLTEFGDNSVNFDVSVWVNDPWESAKLLSKLNQAIWFALQERGIIIAFPQLDVHFDPPVEQSLTRLAAVK